jgi:flagellar assembly factor FliW
MPEPGGQEMLQVRSTRFGEVEVPREMVINFPQGMIGFPALRRYVLIRHREGSPFHWLQALESEDLAFVVVNPLLFDPGYKLTLGGAESRLLAADDPSQLQVWVVVTIPAGHPDKMTANLKAPVVINSANRQAAQVILEDPRYTVRHPLSPQAGGPA